MNNATTRLPIIALFSGRHFLLLGLFLGHFGQNINHLPTIVSATTQTGPMAPSVGPALRTLG